MSPFCCCFCLHTSFLTTQPGMCKIAEVVLSVLSQTLLQAYGSSAALLLGSSYNSYVTATSAVLFTTIILLVAYLLSQNTYFSEVLFNAIASIMIISEAGWLLFKTMVLLWPLYLISPIFPAFPVMMTVSVMGILLAIVHGIDAGYAYKTTS